MQTLYRIGFAGVAVIVGTEIEFKVKAARTKKKNISDSMMTLASLDSKLSVSQSVIDVFRLAHLRVFLSY